MSVKVDCLATDVNKICQWYCCYCGKSYGSIIYKNVNRNEMNNLKYYSNVIWSEMIGNAMNETKLTNGTKLASDLTGIAPTNGIDVSEGIDTMARNRSGSDVGDRRASESQAITHTQMTSSQTQFQQLPPYLSDITTPLPSIHTTNIPKYEHEIITDTGPASASSCSTETSFESTSLYSIESTENNYSQYSNYIPHIPHDTDNNVILDTPTRFVCHRCHHMMCPYCLKVRMKDLHENM